MASSEIEKPTAERAENIHPEKHIHNAAERGFAATDRYGVSLVQFDPAAESRLRTKLDLYVCPTVAFLYLFCFIDRANVGNARLAGLETDLGMVGTDYNTLLSVFYISYILFEIPSNITCKWLGPGWFIPIISLCFGIVSLGTAFVNSLSQACGVRFILGVFEAGMMPGISYYLSRWYRRSELAFRLALFIVMAPLAGAFGGLLASGILSLSHFGGLHRWRMIFAVEGIITIGLSLISFFTLTDRPETARWLTQEEKDLAIARVKSERVSQTRVLDKIDGNKIKRGIFNPMVLATAWLFMFNNITVQGLAFFAPTIVATIYPTATTVQKQLYTVPPYVVGAFFTLLIPYLSWKTDRRQIFFVLSTPLVIVGYIMFLASTDPKVRYAGTFLLTSSTFAIGPLSNAQVAAQVVSDTSRSVAIGMNVMCGNVGGLIATWSYLAWDAPNYHVGNGINLAAASLILLFSTLTLFWMKWDNKRRDGKDIDQELEGMSQEEIESLEWKHPAWRWKP
ncbi:major facilitator superfamily domain-containing protein [Pseudomassariella vexata]|uniref:Major facilitator superfamily domain-containing protein n=1 Tax=Pseudomassariella vexata TaxID=1141098 RepID=A0A1Y2DQ84_9PEZI|nr:major facilitator superfamily domain-containing protein [Pseudomassariella vexata]ORY61451.1 major facilitator superfamily domain-containing protein [Pseudomassariella vexata]